jgi:hypothetical protein
VVAARGVNLSGSTLPTSPDTTYRIDSPLGRDLPDRPAVIARLAFSTRQNPAGKPACREGKSEKDGRSRR